ncbi:MAG: DUF2846 domain-containing protein [Hydrogenophaga sp.]|uniref:DUF2846 domain-containing protein n=1 Tax=Hydrogenophaga sp. TaxID=1904254 RepID=UPI00261E1A69|nr:DUF2846 domain-containing protein [Hydrogenophaga sp.]MCW5670408.1 DUF2846 domain-containing protein [Hydrogenophaga sp.]
MGGVRGWAVALALLAAALLSGCAASGHSYGAVSSALPPLTDKACRVFFYRTDSMFGAAMQPEILLDGQRVGKSQPGGFFYVDTHPGRHLATSQTENEARLEFDIEPGQTMYVASSITFGVLVGRIQLNLQPEALALSELSPLRYTGVGSLPAGSPGLAPAPAAGASPPAAASPKARARVTMADLEALLPPPSAGAAR